VHATIDVAPAAKVYGSKLGSEKLFEELWGKGNEFSCIEEVTIFVPQPEFCLEPGLGFRTEQAKLKFPLIQTPQIEEERTFNQLQTKNQMPCGTYLLLVRSEYVLIETALQLAERERRTPDKSAGTNLDYKLCGQPGSGLSP
jgi:hypothetical protein